MTNPIDDLRDYARHLQSEVPGETARLRVERALRSGPRPRRALVASVAAALLAVSNVALAQVANPAVPGDAMYSIDRAYERLSDLLGGGGHAAERLDEAAVVAARGDAVTALGLVVEALTDSDGAADVERARELIAGLQTSDDAETLDAAVSALVEVAKAVHISDDKQAAAKLISEKAKDVAAAAKALKENSSQAPPVTTGRPEDPGSQGNRP